MPPRFHCHFGAADCCHSAARSRWGTALRRLTCASTARTRTAQRQLSEATKCCTNKCFEYFNCKSATMTPHPWAHCALPAPSTYRCGVDIPRTRCLAVCSVLFVHCCCYFYFILQFFYISRTLLFFYFLFIIFFLFLWRWVVVYNGWLRPLVNWSLKSVLPAAGSRQRRNGLSVRAGRQGTVLCQSVSNRTPFLAYKYYTVRSFVAVVIFACFCSLFLYC